MREAGLFSDDIQIRRVYWVYIYIGLALCVLAGNLVTYAVPIRAGLSMEQFGVILGVGQFIPALMNMLTASTVTRLKLEYWTIIILPLVRILLGVCFVGIAMLTTDKALLTIGFSILFILYMTCPYISNNAIQTILKRLIPEDQLGKHTSRLMLFQFIPSTLLGIAATWVVEYFDDGSPGLFYRLVLAALLTTSTFQVACSVVAWRMMKTDQARELQAKEQAAQELAEQATQAQQQPGSTDNTQPASTAQDNPTPSAWSQSFIGSAIGQMLPPFLDKNYRPFLQIFFFISLMVGMSVNFIFPYFTGTLGWSLTKFQTVSSVMICAGMLFLPVWGTLADKIGGRNTVQASHMGLGICLLFLASGTTWGTWVYIIFGFYGMYGLIGTGVTVGHQYAVLSFADKRLASVYIAGFTLVWGAGGCLGSIGGGMLLEWLRIKTSPIYGAQVHYEIYFMICGLGHLCAGWIVGSLKDIRPKLSRAQVAVELMLNITRALRLRRL